MVMTYQHVRFASTGITPVVSQELDQLRIERRKCLDGTGDGK
jgi:hypothetical protein